MPQTVNQIADDPIREKQLMRRVALMLAEGSKTDKEICRELNISKGALATWKRSPLFLALVDAMGNQIEEKGVKAITDSLMDDAPQNISFIKDVRDGKLVKDNDKHLRNRLTAAKMLLDKQAPNAGDNISEDARKIVVGGKLLGQMLRAMRNEGVIDVTPEDEEAGRIPVRTIDEFQRETEAEAAEAENRAAREEQDRGGSEDPDDQL